MRSLRIKTFYNPNQVLSKDFERNVSKSPLKPKLLMEYLHAQGLSEHFSVTKAFNPLGNADFLLAHSKYYVNDFFNGSDLARTNGLSWSPQFAESIRFTNASIYNAIRNSIVNPDEVSFSPTSGFHHATPNSGRGFCTFSGQVIASVKVWREFKKVGCYLDLDGHFGNSIEDTRKFQPDLNKAVPIGFNFNPQGANQYYYEYLKHFIENRLEDAILSGKIDYVVWCHGADSHADDDMHGQCSTEFWIKCSTFFWSWVKKMDEKLGRPLPVSCALFGGYRSDDYTSVLSLHTADLVECIKNLLDVQVDYIPMVITKQVKSYYQKHYQSATSTSYPIGRFGNLKDRRSQEYQRDLEQLLRNQRLEVLEYRKPGRYSDLELS
jgi:acetoin utilization deacetylase AcuC-like enzyme